ncbi:MAG: ABC transporter permease [Bacteroidota bacterium]
MLSNFLKIAFRNFFLHKVFSFINILGLAIGLACAILIYLFIHDELTFDQIHPDADTIYRMGVRYQEDGGEAFTSSSAPGIWAKALVETYPNVLAGTRNFWLGYPASLHNQEADKIVLTEKLFWIDSAYTDILYTPLISGNKEQLFDQKNAIALSESAARALFGTEDPLGKTIEISHVSFNGQNFPLIVTGVFENYPSNSHLRPDYLINMEVLEPRFGDNFHSQWNGWWLSTYVKVRSDTDAETLAAQMNELLDKNLSENREAFNPFFVKLTDTHFDTEVEWVIEGAGDMSYIYIFGSIALLILLVAAINYMNLATARSTRRAKEIGLRKTMGGRRIQLILQFFGESLLTVLLALVVALGLVALALPAFNGLSGKSFTFVSLFDPWILGVLFLGCLLLAIVSGLYPALYLSSFTPIKVLRKRFNPGSGPELFRKVLVTFQFAVSVVLIVCTGIILTQMRYVHSSKLGQVGDQMVSIRFGGSAPTEKYTVFKQSVEQDPDLPAVTLANHLPRQEYFGPINWNFRFPGVNELEYDWSLLNVEPNFPDLFDLEWVVGEKFPERLPGDTTSQAPFVMNETAVRNLGLSPEEALGTQVSITHNGGTQNGYVLGVVKDFPYRSMRNQVEPTLLSTWPHPVDKIIYVPLPKGKFAEKLAVLEAKWKEVFPGIGFDYWFVDEEFGRMYADEDRMADLAEILSILAILVACLGVYGLASYLAERKTKEIGIRKILGATLSNILLLLSQNFLVVLGIAALIGTPISYFLMKDWLQNFAYKVDMTWWMFAGAIFILFLLTALTVSFETLKAARLDPAKHLRAE